MFSYESILHFLFIIGEILIEKLEFLTSNDDLNILILFQIQLFLLLLQKI